MVNKKRIAQSLEILGQLMPFNDACQSEVGIELLADLRQRYDSALMKIARVEATDKDKIEYEVVRDLLAKWTNRITLYNKKTKEVEFLFRNKANV